MKTCYVLVAWMVFVPFFLQAQPEPAFEDIFMDKTMRIDYFHIGDTNTEIITVDHIYQYGIWAGSRVKLIDHFNNGLYYVKIFDLESGRLVYSQGFNSYFGEYQTSSPAAEGIKRTYHESAVIPCPRKTIRFSLEKRDRKNKLHEVFSCQVDPEDIRIIKERVLDSSVKVIKAHVSGDPHKKVDIAIVGEGYTIDEFSKFKDDLKRFISSFFRYEPYRAMKDKFNIKGVFKPSQESGTDEPRANIYKSTALNSSFNALDSERYLLTEDNKALRDIAAHTPYDALMIMVNHKRYGGGGIYNFYCSFCADTQFCEYIFIHEFGHSFSGLADEYYTSSVAYNEFYPKGIEPSETNITALLDPEKLKWKDLVDKDVALPTPWEKAAYDEMDYAWQERRRKMNDQIAELKKKGAPPAEIKKAEQAYARKDREHSQKVDEFLKKSRYWGKVGVYEGAGYSSQGLYRPMVDCIMFSKGSKPFCKVCEVAIRKVIQHYLE